MLVTEKIIPIRTPIFDMSFWEFASAGGNMLSAQISESALLVQGGSGVAKLIPGGKPPPPLPLETCLVTHFNSKQGETTQKCTYVSRLRRIHTIQ